MKDKILDLNRLWVVSSIYLPVDERGRWKTTGIKDEGLKEYKIRSKRR